MKRLVLAAIAALGLSTGASAGGSSPIDYGLTVAPGVTRHAVTTALGTSLVAKAAAGSLSGFNVSAVTGGAPGFAVAYNSATVPGTGALTGSQVLDFCWFGATAGGCSLFRNYPVAYSAGIVILVTTAASPYTYTTGTATAAITADFQ